MSRSKRPLQTNSMTGELNAIRVVIADGQASFREALRKFLEPEGDVTIVGEASDARGVPALARQLKPDVLLIESALFYSLKGRAAAMPGLRTLVTVPTLDRADIIRAFLQGARAIVPRPSARHVWPECIRIVGAGQYWLGTESIAILVEALRDHFAQRTEAGSPKDYKLTRREGEIMDKIANGHSNKEVGLACSICERTVKHHLTNIFTKVGVSSRLELALFAMSHRLLTATPSPRETISADGRDPAAPARKRR
jgi:two-component system nitrate/nitrite response regulator NarL